MAPRAKECAMLETQNATPEEIEANIKTQSALRASRRKAEGEKAIEVDPADLPLVCPPADTPVTLRHPRVFLAIQDDADFECPYCGRVYRLKGRRPVHSFA